MCSCSRTLIPTRSRNSWDSSRTATATPSYTGQPDIDQSLWPVGPLHMSAIELGDFDGDGDIDLTYVDRVANSLRFVAGNGDATFDPTQAGPGARSMHHVDLDADGLGDLVFANSSSRISIVRRTGKRDFCIASELFHGIRTNPRPHRRLQRRRPSRHPHTELRNPLTNPAPTDPPPSRTLFSNHGGRIFFSTTTSPAFRYDDGVVRDVNGDDHADVLMVGLNPYQVLLGDGAGGFLMDPVGPADDRRPLLRIRTGHFNHDGHVDMAIMGASLLIYLGDGTGYLWLAQTIWVPATTMLWRVSDFDEDGFADVMVAPGGSSVRWHAGRGDGTLWPAVNIDLGSTPCSSRTLST